MMMMMMMMMTNTTVTRGLWSAVFMYFGFRCRGMMAKLNTQKDCLLIYRKVHHPRILHLVTHGHFRSHDKDDSHTIRSAISLADNPMCRQTSRLYVLV